MEPSRSSAALGLLSTGYLLSALVFASAVSALWLGGHLSVPHLDDWLLLDQMYRTPVWSWIFSLQNGHRLPTTLLLLYLDQTWADGRMHLLVVAALTSAWVFALVLALVLREPQAAGSWLRRVLLGFAVFAFFWSGSAYNFRWGVNQGSVWTAMWLLIALAALAGARDVAPASQAGWRVPLAVLAGFLATFGHGIGAAVWPALLAIWTAGRMRAWMGAALAAGALGSLGLYSIGLFGSNAAPAGADSLLGSFLAQPLALLLFVFAFVGAPFAWVLRGLGLVATDQLLAPATTAGALLTLAAGAGFGRLAWRAAALPEVALVGLGLMVFGLVGGGMVGVTRLSEHGPQQAVDLRFLCWSTLFWIGAALAMGEIASSRRARLGLAGALAGLTLAMLPEFFENRALQREEDARAADVAQGLLVGARPESLPLQGWGTTAEMVTRAAEQMSRELRSPFDDHRRDLAGSAFAEHFSAAGQPVCGHAAEVRWLAPAGDVALVQGQLDRDGSTVAYLVLVDEKGAIRGLGDERSTQRGAPAGRWEGVIAGVMPGELYAAYGVLRDGRSACPAGVIAGAGGAGARLEAR
jgi:hypothetical protein